jgi:hypothetical protein
MIGKYLFSMNRNMLSASFEAKAQPSTVKLFGRVPSLGTNLVDIWPQAIVRTLPTSKFTLGIVSDSANDVNLTGTGAWLVAVTYLDTSYISHVAVFATAGTAAWVTTPLYLDGVSYTTAITNAYRINAMEVIEAGSGGFNAGNIYGGDSSSTLSSGVPQTASKIFAQISVSPSPMNIAEMGGYTVPIGGNQLSGGYLDSSAVYHPGILQLQPISGPQQLGVLAIYAAVTPASTTAFYDRVVMGISQYAPAANAGNGNGLIPAVGLQPWKNYVIGGPSSNAGGISPYLPDFLDVVGPMGELRFQAAASAASSEVSIIVEMMQFLATYQGGEM